MRRIAAATVMTLLLARPAAADISGRWSVGADLSLISNDNVTRAQASKDIEKDTATRLRVDTRYALDFSLNRGLIFTGHLQDEGYQDFDGVSSMQAGLEAEYRRDAAHIEELYRRFMNERGHE